MEYFDVEPKFTEQVRKLKPSDPAHADLFNSLIGVLLGNDGFLKTMADQLLLQIQQHISDSQATLDTYYQQSSGYTDQKIADLIGGAPTTLDTLGEIAAAMEGNASVVEALDAAIGGKLNESEFDSHKKEVERALGGFAFYPYTLTQAQYDALDDETKNQPKMLFIIKKG